MVPTSKDKRSMQISMFLIFPQKLALWELLIKMLHINTIIYFHGEVKKKYHYFWFAKKKRKRKKYDDLFT